MSRYGIFVFYDSEGIVQNYVLWLLNSFQDVFSKLVIVINGHIRKEEKLKFAVYTQYIYERENIGFDGGAYKDVFLRILKTETWQDYDEIFLINDTFYGPFSPWKDFLEIMERRNYDFWGLSCNPGRRGLFFAGREVLRHIQSYFICINRTLFLSSCFMDFWSQMEYPKSFFEAVANFEIDFSQYFLERGYSFGSLKDLQFEKSDCVEDIDKVNLDTLITKLHFPVLKRKYLSLNNYIYLKRIFQYLKSTDYPLEVIYEDVGRRIGKGNMKPYCPVKLVEFCRKFRAIYLYGNGKHALNIKEYLLDQGIQVEGNIVSNVEKGENVFCVDDFSLKKDVGIVVALSEKNTCEVYNTLKNKFEINQIFFPEYDSIRSSARYSNESGRKV